MNEHEDSASTATLAYSIPQFAKSTGLSQPLVYQRIKSGELRSFQVGRRRLISRAAALHFIETLEARGTTPADLSAAQRARWPKEAA